MALSGGRTPGFVHAAGIKYEDGMSPFSRRIYLPSLIYPRCRFAVSGQKTLVFVLEDFLAGRILECTGVRQGLVFFRPVITEFQ